MTRAAQHENVGASAKDALLQAGDDDGMDFRVLEADALNRVGKLDVDAEVVGIELEAIVGQEPRIFLYVHRQGRDWPVEGELPVFVAFRGGVERDPRLECVGADCHLGVSVPGGWRRVKAGYCVLASWLVHYIT
jgi:hypothetical protein